VLTQAQIFTAFSDLVGTDLAAMADATQVARWFNEGQQRLAWFRNEIETVTWVDGDVTAAFTEIRPGVEEILYPDAATETRWEATTSGLIIRDYEGADGAGTAKVIVHAYWPDVDSTNPSELPGIGDSACTSYALHRFFRKLVSDRSYFKRYATMAGQNAVNVDDLAQTSDDHYRDFLDLRTDLPDAPAATFFS
jgi:hypothetical protein